MIYFRTMISFLRLTTSDASWLATVGGATIMESHGHSAPAQTVQAYIDKSFNVDACIAELGDENNIFSAIHYNGERAGYSKIVFDCAHPAVAAQPVTKMERLYLLKKFYDLKLGQQLLQHSIDLSTEQGEKGMWLNVWKGNERALRFYQKGGFETVGESKFAMTPTHSNPAWVMLLKY